MPIKKIVIIAIVAILVVFGTLMFSTTAMPDSPFFVIKRWEEKIILSLKRSPSDQISYNITLLNTRLGELDYITATKEYELFYTAALRYGTLAGEITDISTANNMSQKKEILNIFAKQQAKIKEFLSRKNGKEEWKYIRDPYNAITIYIGKINNTPPGPML